MSGNTKNPLADIGKLGIGQITGTGRYDRSQFKAKLDGKRQIIFDYSLIKQQKETQAEITRLKQEIHTIKERVQEYKEVNTSPEGRRRYTPLKLRRSVPPHQPEKIFRPKITGSERQMFALEHLFKWVGQMMSTAGKANKGSTWTKLAQQQNSDDQSNQ